jgi:outer membrane protein TolC
MNRRLRIAAAPAAVAFVLLLAGCSTGYSPALRAWHEAAPQPYVSRTLTWANVSEVADRTDSSALPHAVRFADMASTSTEVVAREVTHSILGALAPPESLDPATLAARLAERLTWPDLAAAVAARNPAVRAAAERWRATLAQFDQAEYLESLIAQYRTLTRYVDVTTPMPLNTGMTQAFAPAGGPVALRGELVRREAAIARLEWETVLRDALLDAGDAFFDCQYLERTERTTRQNIELIQSTLDVVEERYRSGSTTQADLLKIQTELERLRNRLRDVRSQRASALARIEAAIDATIDHASTASPAAQLGPPADDDLADTTDTLDSLVRAATERRQEVLIRRTRVERAAVAIRMGETMNRPLAGDGYSRFERGMMPEASAGEPLMPYGAMRKSIDRPDFARAEAYLGEMRGRLRAEESALAEMRAQSAALARTWFNELDIARRQLQLVEEIVVPQSRSAYETLRGAYSSGRASFLDLLDAERALVTARQELDEARREKNRTLLRRAQVTGRF